MQIKYLNIKDLKPYQRNPRKNDDAVKYVAESIKQFGFKVPIVIDKDNVIVAGNTRYKAAKKLSLTEVPCIVADDLTEEQIKAFRLADNKVAEKAEWDFDLLDAELGDILDIDMDLFGFDVANSNNFELLEDEEDSANERERTNKAYNLDSFDSARSVGFYQMPTLERIDYVPNDLIGFNYALNSQEHNCGIHFFVDDYQFERVWSQPLNYEEVLNKYDCILTPDFSLYMDMPMSMKIWNVYRSRLIGQVYQDRAIKVIPTLSWAEKDTFLFCFDGIPENSTIAVSTIGVKSNEEAMKIWTDGMDEAIRRLKPKNILVYGGDVGYNFNGINVKYFSNHVTDKMKRGEKDA